MLARILATWFGCGLVPKAPGTVGSLGALGICSSLSEPLALALWIGGACTIPHCGLVGGSRQPANSVRKDPQVVVIDEVAGQWIALAGATHLNWLSLGIGFVSFRIFDIWKPWPTRALEKLPGGWGIVLDDCMAGIYAGLVLFGCGWFNFY